MDENRKTDLSEIAVSLVFHSIGYAILGVVASSVVFLLIRIVGYESLSDQGIWLLSFAIWVTLQSAMLIKLSRIAKLQPPVTRSGRAIHGFELCTAGFLVLFAFARPYLIESDASSYPYIERLFQIFIGMAAFFHILVLVIFKAKPRPLDLFSLGGAIIIAFAPIFR